MKTYTQNNDDLFDFLKNLGAKYRCNITYVNFALTIILAIWLNSIEAEQDRRTVAVKTMENSIVQTIVSHNDPYSIATDN